MKLDLTALEKRYGAPEKASGPDRLAHTISLGQRSKSDVPRLIKRIRELEAKVNPSTSVLNQPVLFPMPEDFVLCIDLHGGSWMEWNGWTTEFATGPKWCTNNGCVEKTATVSFEAQYYATVTNPFVCSQIRFVRNFDGWCEHIYVSPGEHSQQLENWFYQARMASK